MNRQTEVRRVIDALTVASAAAAALKADLLLYLIQMALQEAEELGRPAKLN